MALTRREFIGRMALVAGYQFLPPIVFRAGEAFGEVEPDPDTQNRNRLVVIFQQGGNDGLNMVAPRDDVSGAPRFSVYKKVRPAIHYEPNQTLPLDLAGDAGEMLGLNPNLELIHKMYREGRVAVVQGVDYPNHNYSHFESTDIWHSGQPEMPKTGWLGRHFDRAGLGAGELRGLGIGYELPLMLRGDHAEGVEVQSVSEMRFLDGNNNVGNPRHAAFARFGDHPPEESLRRFAGEQARQTVQLVDRLQTVGQPPSTPNYLANSLLTARLLMQENLGVECVFVWHSGGQGVGGYDTHSAQKPTQERLLSDFDEGIEAFLFGTRAGQAVTFADGSPVGALPPQIAARTLIMSVSEFGRRIGENGTGDNAGTDHGAAAPAFLIGPPADQPVATGVRLTPGLHGDHPDMGSVALPADNLNMTVDLRRLYQSALEHWLGDPDPSYGTQYQPLANLFAAS